MQAGLEWSQQQAKEQGLQQQHFCDYLLFLDADQVWGQQSSRKDAHVLQRLCAGGLSSGS